MQRACETLDHFPSFAQIIEIDAELGGKSNFSVDFRECDWCDGYGIVLMENQGSRGAFACDCRNGILQFEHAKARKFPDGRAFRMHYAGTAIKYGFWPINLSPENEEKLRRKVKTW